MTVKTRITLFIVGAGFIASLLFSAVVFYELIEQPFDILDTVLKEEAYKTARMIVERQKKSDLAGHPDSYSHALDKKYWIEIYGKETNKILYRSGLAKLVKLPPVEPGSSAVARAILLTGQIHPEQGKTRREPFRIRSFSIELDGRSFVVQIARSLEELKSEIEELVFSLITGLILSTLALIFISRFLAGRILQPMGQMKDLARDISEKNLDRRIPTGKGQDEFSELASTINRMLDRLQYSFLRQRNFLFDTSHELKTPLTTMRLAVDEMCALDGENLPPFVMNNLLRLNRQVLRMDRLVKDLLNLSSLETLTRIDPKPVYLTELLSSLAEEYKFLANAHNITMAVRLAERLVFHGDEEKLRRAFSNILDNAVKFNVDGGRIEVTGDQSPTELMVTVANTGPGVPEAQIHQVFDQFYRVEKSRSIQHGGFGLGLAIVKRIVELHGGKVKLESQQEAWTRVTVILPRRGYAVLS